MLRDESVWISLHELHTLESVAKLGLCEKGAGGHTEKAVTPERPIMWWASCIKKQPVPSLLARDVRSHGRSQDFVLLGAELVGVVLFLGWRTKEGGAWEGAKVFELFRLKMAYSSVYLCVMRVIAGSWGHKLSKIAWSSISGSASAVLELQNC